MLSVKSIGALAVVVAMGVLSSQSMAATRFGAKLSKDTPGTGERACKLNGKAPNCTWIMMEARGRPGGYRAPKDGMIGKIRVVACDSGKFTLQIARTRPNKGQGKVVRNGPQISYEGTRRCNFVEEFTLENPVPVQQGDQLAIREREPSLLYCAGNGSILQFIPPLKPSEGFRAATEDEGACMLLLEAEYID